VLWHDRVRRRRGGRRPSRGEQGAQPAALRDRRDGAIYHSHTRSAPEPSQTDINLAFYPDALYVIVGVAGEEADVRAWRIVDRQVSEVELEVT
jgi:proteasome lid subunit RPN8/RPN11